MEDERLRKVEERAIRIEARQESHERRMSRFETHMDRLAQSVDTLTEVANRLDARFEAGSRIGRWVVGVLLSLGGMWAAIMGVFR